jgi:hypothetical protein
LLSASFLPDLLLNPSVYVEIDKNQTWTPELLITNDGSSAANNLHVYLLAWPPNKIVNITNIFSTTPVNLVRSITEPLEKHKSVTVNSDTVEILIPKLVQGPGSRAHIRTLSDSENGIQVITSYDEGSGIGSTTTISLEDLLPASNATPQPPLPVNITDIIEGGEPYDRGIIGDPIPPQPSPTPPLFNNLHEYFQPVFDELDKLNKMLDSHMEEEKIINPKRKRNDDSTVSDAMCEL